MKVGDLRASLEHYDDDDEVICLLVEHDEISERAEETGISVDREAWNRIVHTFQRRANTDRPWHSFIDARVRQFGYHTDDCRCDDCIEAIDEDDD